MNEQEFKNECIKFYTTIKERLLILIKEEGVILQQHLAMNVIDQEYSVFDEQYKFYINILLKELEEKKLIKRMRTEEFYDTYKDDRFSKYSKMNNVIVYSGWVRRERIKKLLSE